MQHAIRYLRRSRIETLGGVDPTLTVLRWLREHAGLTGTKEGCAEGDCGACTVVLGEPDGDAIRYRAVNACILFVHALDGKQLITVEDLAAPDGALHPVQQAMVDAHGSQCGFCTPGFVMSLFALYKADAAPDRQTILDALAGNLCRCTGYRPIIEAAVRMHGSGTADQFTAAQAADLALLKTIQRDETLAVEDAGRRLFAPVSVDALAALCVAHPDAVLLAGGTDVGLWVTKEHRSLDTVIYVGDVAALREIHERDGAIEIGAIEIGAAATYTDAFPVLARHYPDFGALLRRLGALQVRNTGTIGGNIGNASPIGDTPPVLIALGATVVLRHGDKERDVPLEDFFVDYRQTVLALGEFIQAIRVPASAPERRFGCYKVSKRFDQDISAVCGAFVVTRDGDKVSDARLCYGGMAATPKRAGGAEAALRGKPWNEATVRAAMVALDGDFAPLTDFRASADYRRRVAANLLYRFYLETTPAAPATRVLEHV